MISAFYANADLRELKRGLADYWIIYVTRGFADFVAERNVCRVDTDRVLIISTGNKDIQIDASKDYEGLVLQIRDPEAADIIRPYLHLMEIYDEIMNVASTGGQQNSILAVFKKLADKTKNPVSEQKTPDLLQELMVRLYRASLRAPVGMYSNRVEIATAIQERLRKEYGKDFSLASIAMEYDLSVSYLAHVFKETTGMPMMRFLLCCRVDAAKEFLEQTALSVNEIATRCGFHDISNFGRTFKKEVGCSPRDYRKRCRIAAKERQTQEV